MSTYDLVPGQSSLYCQEKIHCGRCHCQRRTCIGVVVTVLLLLGLAGFLIWFLVFRSVGRVFVAVSESGGSNTLSRRLLGWGVANASELHSLRYSIGSIMLATTLSSTGSAYQLGSAKTWTIYRGLNTAGDYDSFDSAYAQLLGPDAPEYLDLRNATQRSLLSSRSEPLTALQAGLEYNFIVINWKRPIWVSAQVSVCVFFCMRYSHSFLY